jgi:hypothetical protein
MRVTYHRDIDRNEINMLVRSDQRAGSGESVGRAALSEALAAFRERAARLAESDHAATFHPHEQARVHHRIGADSARKAIAAKIRALPLLEDAQSLEGYFAITDIDLCERDKASSGEIDSAKRHLIVGGEI